jgi:small subunit ribosomal protein S17e
MGRIKSISVKTLADELIRARASSFTTDFVKNKKALNEIKPIKSKKVKNVLAGYITKKMKSVQETGL